MPDEEKPKEQPEETPQVQPVRNVEGLEEAVKTVQLLVFTLDKEEYATIITDVREITEITEITEVPNAPTFIEGIINLRGKVVVVVNLEERFRLVRDHPEIKPEHIIIVEIGEATFGVIVDEVTEVLRIPEANIKEAPAIISSKIQADFLSGVGLVEERLILLLDFNKVLSEKELAELSKLTEFQQKKVVKPLEEEEKKVDVGRRIEEKVAELAAKKKAESAERSRSAEGTEPSRSAEKEEAKKTKEPKEDKPETPKKPEAEEHLRGEAGERAGEHLEGGAEKEKPAEEKPEGPEEEEAEGEKSQTNSNDQNSKF